MLEFLLPLYGGGFGPAVGQLVAFYYVTGCIIHFAVPRLIPVQHIQKHARGKHDVWRDALYSLGATPRALEGQADCVCAESDVPPGMRDPPLASTYAHGSAACAPLKLLTCNIVTAHTCAALVSVPTLALVPLAASTFRHSHCAETAAVSLAILLSTSAGTRASRD